MTIKMTSVYVNDPIRAFEFYTNTLGFKEMLFMPDAQLAIVHSPEQPNGVGLLLEPNGNPIAKTYQTALYNAGLPVIVFGVGNVEEEYKRLSGQGVIFKELPSKNDWGAEAVFDDTCGNYIKIHQG